jgi:hypothetical protein
MTRRPFFLALVVLGTLLLPGTAAAKGPTEATITGPRLSSPLAVSGYGEGGPTPLGRLVDWGGFFPQAFGQSPDPIMARPAGLLGPRYDVTYVVPGPSTDKLRQQLYPYAAGGVYTYMEPEQKFWGDQSTRGGWYRANTGLKSVLVQAGLPAKAPKAHRRAANSRKAVAIGAGAGLVLAGGAFLLLRRRR